MESVECLLAPLVRKGLVYRPHHRAKRFPLRPARGGCRPSGLFLLKSTPREGAYENMRSGTKVITSSSDRSFRRRPPIPLHQGRRGPLWRDPRRHWTAPSHGSSCYPFYVPYTAAGDVSPARGGAVQKNSPRPTDSASTVSEVQMQSAPTASLFCTLRSSQAIWQKHLVEDLIEVDISGRGAC
jgi:hypothetical protein